MASLCNECGKPVRRNVGFGNWHGRCRERRMNADAEITSYLARWAAGLNLKQFDDRAIFRQRVRDEAFASMKFTAMRKLAGPNVKDRIAAARTIANRYMETNT